MLTHGGTVTAQFIRDNDPRQAPADDQPGDESLGGTGISTGFHQDVENLAIAIDRAPKPVFLASDRDYNLIQMPFVSGCLRAARTRLAICAPNFPTYARMAS